MIARAPRLLAGGLLVVVVVAYAAFAWREAENRARETAEIEARALLHTVAAGIESTIAAGWEMEDLLRDRLDDLARDLERELGATPGREQHTLAAFVRAHRLRGAVLLREDLSVWAASSSAVRPESGGPFDAERLDILEAESLARDVAERGPRGMSWGFGESPVGQLSEYTVLTPSDALGGYLLIRERTESIERFRERAGVQRLLDASLADEGIRYLALQDIMGDVTAAAGLSELLDELPPPEAHGAWRATSPPVFDISRPAAVYKPGDARATYVRVGLAAEPVEAVISSSRRSVLLFGVLALALGAGGLFIVGRLERAAQAREAALQRQLEARERFAALGRLASGIAHEIRSPLNALSMAAQRLRRAAASDDPDARARIGSLLDALDEAVRRTDGTVEDFLAMGRDPPPLAPERFDVADLVREIVGHESSDAELDVPSAPVLVETDRVLLGRALANLLRNAKEVAPPGTTEVAWRMGARGGATIEVSDGGEGIPPEERERIFEPFRTGRRGGTGLGLTIARDAVERLGGSVSLRTAPSGGALFAIEIPGGDA